MELAAGSDRPLRRGFAYYWIYGDDRGTELSWVFHGMQGNRPNASTTCAAVFIVSPSWRKS